MIRKIGFNLALLLLPTFIVAAPPIKEIPLSSQATTLKIPFNCVGAHEEPIPKLTVIFVADGVPSASIDKVDKFLTGGIKSLRNRGVRYLNVFHPHANCSTAQGHASLTTGTFPIYHGIRLLSKLQFRTSACARASARPFPINFFVEPF